MNHTVVKRPSPQQIKDRVEKHNRKDVNGEAKARMILKELQDVCEKHGLWFSHTEERKPDLKMIKVNEISIKIDGRRPRGAT